jgi:hypothetical protein
MFFFLKKYSDPQCNTGVRIFICFCRAIFFSEFNIRLYDNNSESDYFFSLHQNQNIFFNNIGNQNPPLQVKWSVPYTGYIQKDLAKFSDPFHCIFFPKKRKIFNTGLWFLVSFRNFFPDNTRVRIFIFFCRAKRNFFYQNSTLGYMTTTLNQIIFFPSTKIRIKWSVPYTGYIQKDLAKFSDPFHCIFFPKKRKIFNTRILQ